MALKNIQIIAVSPIEYSKMNHEKGDYFCVVPRAVFDMNLSTKEFHVWLHLWNSGFGCSFSKLSRLTNVKPAQLTKMLHSLERRGLIYSQMTNYADKTYTNYCACYLMPSKAEPQTKRSA